MDRAERSERGDEDVSVAGVHGLWRLLVACRCDKEIKSRIEEDVRDVRHISDGMKEDFRGFESRLLFLPFTMLLFGWCITSH